MDKRPDFGDDLTELSKDVSQEVSDVINAVRKQKRTIQSTGTTTIELASTREHESAPQEVSPKLFPAQTSRRRSSRTEGRERQTANERNTIFENVTTRLSQGTNELLTEASLRQRLKKAVPATRQDIVEEALGDWFRKHGYQRD